MEKEAYLHLISLNIHTEFPYLVLEVLNDRSNPRKQPGFWHADLQFLYVRSGIIEIQTLAVSRGRGRCFLLIKMWCAMRGEWGSAIITTFISHKVPYVLCREPGRGSDRQRDWEYIPAAFPYLAPQSG